MDVQVVTHPWAHFNNGLQNAVEFRVRMSNYVTLFYMDIIIYTYPNLNAALLFW